MATTIDAHGLVILDEEECWAFLARHFLGRIGLVELGAPLVFPVNYALDGRSIVFRTAPGTKLAAAARMGVVVVEVDEATELFETGTSVMAHGSILEVTDPQERQRLARLPIRVWAPGHHDHVVRVLVHRISGRRIPLRGNDDGLLADGG